MYNKNLQKYWERVLSFGLEDEVTEILKIEDNEKRLAELKRCFMKVDPKLLDEKLVWNLYLETL